MEPSNLRRATATLKEAAGAVTGDVDCLSALNDDLLLRILSFLPAAKDVARTSVLSRRWRPLWSQATALRFTVGPAVKSDTVARDFRERNAGRVIASAGAALSRRDGGPDVERLEISFLYTSEGEPPPFFNWGNHEHADIGVTSAHVAEWLLFAARRVTGQFLLAVPVPLLEPPAPVLFVELPSAARFQEMSLYLGQATLTVPATAAGAFHALADFYLSEVRVDAAAGVRLGHLLSSSCSPWLRRLQLIHIDGLAALHLDAAGTLEYLRLFGLSELRTLDVAAPGLRELRVWSCAAIEEATISAPRLEKLSCNHLCPRGRLQLDGAASVRLISGLKLSSHQRLQGQLDGDEHYDNGIFNPAAVRLLRLCTSLNRLNLSLNLPRWRVEDPENMEHYYKNMIQDLPQFQKVRKLELQVPRGAQWQHHLEDVVVKLVSKFPNLEYLLF